MLKTAKQQETDGSLEAIAQCVCIVLVIVNNIKQVADEENLMQRRRRDKSTSGNHDVTTCYVQTTFPGRMHNILQNQVIAITAIKHAMGSRGGCKQYQYVFLLSGQDDMLLKQNQKR